MTGQQLRVTLRWLHIAIAAIMGTFIYSPWTYHPVFLAVMQWFVFPLLIVTGMVMWQQGKVMKLFQQASKK